MKTFRSALMVHLDPFLTENTETYLNSPKVRVANELIKRGLFASPARDNDGLHYWPNPSNWWPFALYSAGLSADDRRVVPSLWQIWNDNSVGH
jgi:hypothetical protein